MKLGASCCVRFVAIFFIVLGFVVLLLAGLLSDPTGQQIALRSLTSLPPFLTDKLTKFGVLNVVQGRKTADASHSVSKVKGGVANSAAGDSAPAAPNTAAPEAVPHGGAGAAHPNTAERESRRLKGQKRGGICRSLWWGGASDRFCTCASYQHGTSWQGAFHSSWLGGLPPAALQMVLENATAASSALPLPHSQLVAALRDADPTLGSPVPPPLNPLAAALQPPPLRADDDPLDPLGDVTATTGGVGCLRLGPAPCPPVLRVLAPGDGLPPRDASSDPLSKQAAAHRRFADRRAAVSHAVLSRVPTVLQGALPAEAARLLQAEVGLWAAAERGTALGGMRRQAHSVFLLRQQSKANEAPPVQTPSKQGTPPTPPKNLRLPWEAPHGVHNMDADVPVQYLLDSGGHTAVLNKTEFLYHTGTLQQWASGDLTEGSRQFLGGGEGAFKSDRNSTKHPAVKAVEAVLGDLFGVANEALIREAMEVRSKLGGASASKSPPTVRLWSGEAGVTAQTHYDHVENFFIQLQGYKRVVLYPPSDAAPLHPFPSLHPSYHQSQLSPRSSSVMDWTAWASVPVFRAAAEAFNASSASSLAQRADHTKRLVSTLTSYSAALRNGSFPSGQEQSQDARCALQCCAFESARLPEAATPPLVKQTPPSQATKRHYGSPLAQEVVLGPGDVLYIPPMWWHRITALSPSQSVSVVSSSAVDVLSSRATWHPLPVGSVVSNPVARTLAAQAYLSRLLQILKPHMDSGISDAGPQPMVVGGDAEVSAPSAGEHQFLLNHKPSTANNDVVPCVSALQGKEFQYAPEAPCTRPGREGDDDSAAALRARAGVSDEAAQVLVARWLPLYSRDAATQHTLAKTRRITARTAKSVAEQLLRGVPSSSLTCPAGTSAQGGRTRRQFKCFRPDVEQSKGGEGGLNVRPLTPEDQLLVDSVANVTRLLPRLHGVAESVASWLWYDGPTLGGLAPPKPPLDWDAMHAIDALRSEVRGVGPPVSAGALASRLGGDRARLTPGQLRLLVWDYVEAIAMWAVGDCSVPAFIRECLWRQDGWYAAGSAVQPAAMMAD